MRSFWKSLILVHLVYACGGPSHLPQSVSTEPPPKSSLITAASFDSAHNRFFSLAFNNPERAILRKKIIDYLFTRANKVLAGSDYDAVVDLHSDIIELYTPEEISRGLIPEQLEPVAQYLIQNGSPRGDEARVLSALLVLKLLHPQDTEVANRYERLKNWGKNARDALGDPENRFEGLITIWEEHARLTPTTEVLDNLCSLYTDYIEALVQYLQSVKHNIMYSATILQRVQQTLFYIAAVYLRYGDTASALARTEALGISAIGARTEVLLDNIRGASKGGDIAAGALWQLAQQYIREDLLDVGLGICRSGLRIYSRDPTFPRCLAKISAQYSDYMGAMAWYSKAIDMVPDQRPLYDETLKVLNILMAQGLFDTDPTKNRKLARRATEILNERMKRWPDISSPVPPEKLQLIIAIAEMNAGNVEEAERRFRASNDLRENLEALLQLGLLLERTDRGKEALQVYHHALNLTSDKSLSEAVQRAEIWERIGNAYRLIGDSEQASQAYRTAIDTWEKTLPALEGIQFGTAQLRLGILKGRLGSTEEALDAFDLAMKYAPTLRDTYASILSFLLSTTPDNRFGHSVYRRAIRQLSLDPEWKVYFALWLRGIAGRSGTSLDPEVNAILEELSEGSEWWAKLARFGTGKIPFTELLSDASGLGERTEAYFYEATRLLGMGDVPTARDLLGRVLETRMVNFYEFAIAQELISTISPMSSKVP